MIYQWKTEGLYCGISPQDAGEEIESCISSSGNITPESVVEKARTKTSVLHSIFVWDNDQAAELYRIDQARALIRNIVTITVFKEKSNDPIEPVRAFVHIVDSNVKGYKSIKTVIYTPQDYEYMMKCAMEDLRAFARKYAVLSKIGGKISVRIIKLLDAIDEFLKGDEEPEE